MATGKTKIIAWVSLLIAGVVALGAGYTWAALSWSYSKGERAGYIQKFSQKGWLCKTWEGELTLIPVPGSAPEKFLFSVRDEAVSKKVSTFVGKKIAVYYEQHKGIPTTCFGETEYFATDVKVVE